MLSGQTRPKAGKPQISQISQIQPVSIDGLAIRPPENLRNRRNLRISLPGFLLPRSGPFSQATRAKSLVSKKLSVDTKWQDSRGSETFQTPLTKARREECKNGPVLQDAQGGTERSH